MNHKMRLRIHKGRYILLGAVLASIAFFVYFLSPKINYIGETKAQEENMPQDISNELQNFGLFTTQSSNTNEATPERSLKQFPQDIPKKTTQETVEQNPVDQQPTNNEQNTNKESYTSIEGFFERMQQKQNQIEATNQGETTLSSEEDMQKRLDENQDNEYRENQETMTPETEPQERSFGILGLLQQFSKITKSRGEDSDLLPSIETDTSNIKLKSDPSQSESELLSKGFTKQYGKFKGKLSLDLTESEGTIPFDITLQSIDGDIQIDIPAETIIKTKNNENYKGIFIPPLKESSSTFLSKKTNIIKAGSLDESIELVDINGNTIYATIEMKISNYEVGQLVNVYSSQDNNNRELLTRTSVREKNSERYISFPTNHFTVFALGTTTGTFTINNDAYITTGTSITLNGTIDGATQMRFGTSTVALANASWETYSTSAAFSLNGSPDGIVTVYAQYSGAGISANVSDSIVLDTFSNTITNSLVANIDGTTAGENLVGTNFTNTNTTMSSISGEDIMSLNGTTAYATSASNLGITAFPFSFAAWFKADKITGLQSILHMGRTNSANYERGILLSGNKPIIVARNTTLYYSNSSTTIQTGKRYHIVGVFNSATDKSLYINGNLSHTFTTSVAFASSTQNRIRVGVKSLNTPTAYFSGNIDEARVYNRALTTTEISGLYMRPPVMQKLKTFNPGINIYGFMTEKIYNIDLEVCNNTFTVSNIGNKLWSTYVGDCVPVGFATGTDYAKTVTGIYTKVYGVTGTFVLQSGLIINIPYIEYSPSSITTSDVLAQIKPFDPTWIMTSTGGTGHLFTGNTSYTFDYADEVGNIGSKSASVDWISFLSFTGVSSGSSYGYYTGVTINFSGNLLSGATISGLNNSYYNDNFQDGDIINGTIINTGGTYIFTLYDLGGNTTGAIFTIKNAISISLTGSIGYYTSGSSFTVTGTYSEEVTDFTVEDITTTNLNISNFTNRDNRIYTWTATPSSEGPFTIQVLSGKVQNATNDTNKESNILSGVYDTTEPTLLFTGHTPGNYRGTSNTNFSGELEITENNLNTYIRSRSGKNYSIYDSGLLLMINFDNKIALGEVAGTTIKDISHYKKESTIYNNPSRTASGKRGGAYLFNGSNTYIHVEDFKYTGEDFTIAFRINPQTRTDFNQHIGSSMSSRGTFRFYTTADGSIYVGTDDATKLTPTELPSNTLEANTRQHFSFSYDGSKGYFYKNGELLASKTMNPPANRTELFIGTNTNTTLDGTLDELRFYNRTLSSGDIDHLYKSNIAKITSDKRNFSTLYTGLAYGEYSYTGLVSDLVGFSTTTGRMLYIDESDKAYLPINTNTEAIINYFESKGFSYSATGLVGSVAINLKKNNSICPLVPLNIESTETIGGNKAILELPGCLKVLSGEIAFTGTIEIPRTNPKSFTLINNSQDVNIFVGSTGSKLFFTETGSSNSLTGKIHIPMPSKNIGEIIDIYSSSDNESRSYEGTGQVLSRNGENYITLQTNHLTYFAFGNYTGNFVINNDVSFTSSTSVTLNINVEGATQMKFGNTQQDAESAERISYATGYNRTLSEGFGNKTVYALFSDGTQTGYVNDTIELRPDITISNVQFTPTLDLSYFGLYNFSAEISGDITTGGVEILGINGEGNNCINYYASGSCASPGEITSFLFSLNNTGDNIRQKTGIYADAIYPEIFFGDSEIMYSNTGEMQITNKQNYSLMNIKNPFAMTGNTTFRIELGIHTGENIDPANLEVYIAKSGLNTVFFTSDRRNTPEVQFISALNKTTLYNHDHDGNAHHLIALATNDNGTIGTKNIDIQGDFRIILYTNTGTLEKSRSLKYLPSPLCENINGRYLGNGTSWTVTPQSGCPDIHMHIARQSTPPLGTSPDGVKATVYANFVGGTVSEFQTFYFNTSNIRPNSSAFISPTKGNFSGDIQISWYPASDGNKDPLTYTINLLSKTGSIVEMLTGNTTNTGFVRDSSSIADGEYTLNGVISDGEYQTTFYLGDTFVIDHYKPTIVFTGSTPESGSTIATAIFSGFAEITENSLQKITRNRNGSNYTTYDSGILLMYNFDKRSALGESISSIKDFGFYENEGTAINTTRTSDGKFEGAYNFDGLSSYIETSQTIPRKMNEFTASARFTTSSDQDQKILSSDQDYHQLQTISGHLRICLNECSDGTTIINDGSWHFVTVVGDDSSIRVYLDGKDTPEINQTAGSSTLMNHIFRVGAIGAGGGSTPATMFFSGIIDEVRIYNKALSVDEVQQLYKTNLTKIETDKWLFSTYQACLPEATYQYEISATDIATNTTTTGRTVIVQFPPLSAGTPVSGLNITGLMVSIASDTKEFEFTGPENTFWINDTKGYTGWYTTIELSGDLKNQSQTNSIPREQIQFKGSNSIITLEGKSSSGVQVATGITNYKVMTGIFNYLIKNITPECSSCIIGKYGNNPFLKVTINDSQIADTYNGTLVFTLYEDTP